MKNTRTQKRLTWQGWALIIIGILGMLFFTLQIPRVMDEIDTKLVAQEMHKSSEDMSKLKSVAGGTIAEAYYQDWGDYLYYETKVYNAQLWNQRYQIFATDMIGILVSVFIFVFGTKSTTEKAVAVEKATTPKKKVEKKSESEENDAF